jgi:hypothetical protein
MKFIVDVGFALELFSTHCPLGDGQALVIGMAQSR